MMKVKKHVTVKVKITLTQDEVNFLCALASSVCGTGKAREISDRIYYALEPLATRGECNSNIDAKDIMID